MAGDTYSDGIHIQINDVDYLNAIYNNAKSDSHHSGDSSFASYITLSKIDEHGNWVSYDLGTQDVTRKFVNEPDFNNKEIIVPTEVIANGMIEAGTYGYQLHVPGYRDIEVYCDSHDPADQAKLLKIINGAKDPGIVYFQQNEDYSVTVFAGKKPDNTSNFEDLKKNWIGFSWTGPNSSGGAGWDYYGDDAIIDNENGQVIGYTKEYSSFVLTTREKVDPAPSNNDSSKSSSSKKADNVVTCQMAGFPASYAWNESAKACQPGYIDNNGVFHLTAGNTNKRVGVVNTSDKGIGGMIASLAASTVMAIMASYLLKKYR